MDMTNSSNAKHYPRLILRNFLSLDICKELEFIHKSCCTIGYRPNVFSTTLSHLVATNSAHLIIPFVPIREKLKEKVEEYFGCEYELFVEFTGLISWCKGASIGWHSDDNRPYLKQRAFAVVCYLNSYNVNFNGGLFHFQEGEPSTIVPLAGDVVMYTADTQNIHSVDEVTEGERVTLTLWFTRDESYNEDASLISSLNNLNPKFNPFIPIPASNNMYWFPPEALNFDLGFDIRYARLSLLGFDLYSVHEKNDLIKPLQLVLSNVLLEKEFGNVLHALQVVRFYCWKMNQSGVNEVNEVKGVKMINLQREKVNGMKVMYIKDVELAEKYFRDVSLEKDFKELFEWVNFNALISDWEGYTDNLRKELVKCLPYWRKHHSIFSYENTD